MRYGLDPVHLHEFQLQGMTMATATNPAINRVSIAVIWPAAFLAAAFGLLGCSTRVKVLQNDPALAEQLAAEPVIAIAGVTVCPTVGGILAPDDALAAAVAMQRAFSDIRPDLVTWLPTAFQIDRYQDHLAKLMHEYGKLGRLRPDQVAAPAASPGDHDMLVLARLVQDDIRSLSSQPQAPPPAAGSAASDETDLSWTTTVSTERRITITMEIFDARTGDSLWKAKSEARARETYHYEDRLHTDPEGYLKERLAAAPSPIYLQRRGEYLKLPDLVDLIGQAVSVMVQRLPAAEG
jgi:hypothetical protein